MSVIAIIQARMGATRLPGKVLKKILGKPMLQLEIERIQRAKTLDQIVIATTTNPADDPIIQLADYINIPSFRGSETDVLDRYYQAAKRFTADVIVRITGDCPLIDPALIDRIVTTFLKRNNDYVSNTLKRTFVDRGMEIEAISFKALKTAHTQATHPDDREHVTLYIWRQPTKFKTKNVAAKVPRLDIRITVDELADFQLVKTIFNYLYPQNPYFTLNDVIAFLDTHPQIKQINKAVMQKHVPVLSNYQ